LFIQFFFFFFFFSFGVGEKAYTIIRKLQREREIKRQRGY